MKINEFKQNEAVKLSPARFSPKFPEVKEEDHIDEGDCDVATKSDIEKMTGKQYVAYAKWKKECEATESGDDEKYVASLEGKSPHKKGTKKYNKHMAAIHAGESNEVEMEDSNKEGDYAKGDLVVINGRSYILSEYEDGIWWATDDDGGDIEFTPGDEDHHEAMGEAESPDEEDWENDVTRTLRKIVDEHQAQKVKFDNGKKTTVDAFTASAVVQGLDALRPDLQVKAADFINKSPGHLVKFSEMVFGSQKEGYGESVDPVGLAVNVMREAFADYEKDSSERWNKYSTYRDLRQKMAHVASRIEEGKMKQLSMDLDDKEMSDEDFKKKYGAGRAEMKKDLAGNTPV